MINYTFNFHRYKKFSQNLRYVYLKLRIHLQQSASNKPNKQSVHKNVCKWILPNASCKMRTNTPNVFHWMSVNRKCAKEMHGVFVHSVYHLKPCSLHSFYSSMILKICDHFLIKNWFVYNFKARHTPWLRHVNYVVVFYRSYRVSHTLATVTAKLGSLSSAIFHWNIQGYVAHVAHVWLVVDIICLGGVL